MLKPIPTATPRVAQIIGLLHPGNGSDHLMHVARSQEGAVQAAHAHLADVGAGAKSLPAPVEHDGA